MKVLKRNTERCKQCGLCVHNCPKQAITFGQSINKKGYRFIVVDDDKCIRCGVCYTVCPDGVYSLIEAE